MYIKESQPHISIVMATHVIEKCTFVEILSPTGEDQIDSFVSSDVENNDNEL